MHTLDYIIVLIYLAGVVTGGIFSARSARGDADEYFTAKGTLKGPLGTIMIGLSIAATLFSGISLVVYVSAAYTDGIKILLGLVSLLAAWLVLHWWFLPRYLAGEWRHPYEIIERRFGYRLRMFMSAQFLLLRLAWMGVLIYAPTLIILGSAGLDDRWFWPVVATLGATSTLYTVIGGIRGVIVMDAVQFLVTAGCMLLIMIFVMAKLGMTWGVMVGEWHAQGRLSLFNASDSPTHTLTFGSVLIGMMVTSFGSYLADQMSLQRYLASDTRKNAGRSFIVNIVGAFGIIIILVLVGLMLWLWYRHNPDPNLPLNADQILPYFIAKNLPAGFSGLLIAAIVSATIDSITSGVNAVSAALTNDWLVPLGRSRSSDELVRFGRLTNLGIGVLATLSAGLAAMFGPALDSSQILMGSFLGSMLACMLLAVSTFRVRPGAVMIGMASGLIGGWLVAGSSVSVMWTAPAALACALGLPLLDLLCFGPLVPAPSASPCRMTTPEAEPSTSRTASAWSLPSPLVPGTAPSRL